MSLDLSGKRYRPRQNASRKERLVDHFEYKLPENLSNHVLIDYGKGVGILSTQNE